MTITKDKIIKYLKSRYSAQNIAGMERFGIFSKNKLGISNTDLRKYGKTIGRDHKLALELWASGIFEARLLASFIDDPKQVTEAQLDKWVKDFDSWALCDTVCGSLFDRTSFAYKKAWEWVKSDLEYVKRAGLVMMTWRAVHDKTANDRVFIDYFPVIKANATDERNFIKKAVNWALRQIGKRNKNLNTAAIKCAKEIALLDSKAAKWIAKDALTELTAKKFTK